MTVIYCYPPPPLTPNQLNEYTPRMLRLFNAIAEVRALMNP